MEKGKEEANIGTVIAGVIGLIILGVISRIGLDQFAGWLLWLIAVLMSIYLIGIFYYYYYQKEMDYSYNELYDGTIGIILNRIFWWGIPITIVLIIFCLITITSDIFNNLFNIKVNYYVLPITLLGILSPIGLAWWVVEKIFNIKYESFWISIVGFICTFTLSLILFEEYVYKLYLPSLEYDSSILITLLIITLVTVIISYGITYFMIKNRLSSESDY